MEKTKDGSPFAVPRHVAIIMDGNNRWAKKRLLPGVAGHKAGVDAVRAVIEVCAEAGVEVLTLFAFSSENWQRPAEEVSALMELFLSALRREAKKLNANDISLRIIGDRSRFHPELQAAMREEDIAFAAQNRWIGATNGQLIAQSAVAFMPTPSSLLAARRKEVLWDIEFAGVVDRTALIHRQALSDRVYLRQPFLNIHPKIAVPTEFAECVPSVDAAYPSAALVLESASAPSAPLASVQLSPMGVAEFSPSPYAANPYSRNDSSKVAPLPTAQPIEAFALAAAPAPRTIQMSITVPPGVAAGTRLRFKTPQGRDMECAVPPGVLPGMQFVAQVEEGPPPTTTPLVSLPRTIQVYITVPPGVAAGAKLRFRASPQGREMECTVPPGVLPGMQFMAQVTE